jgi:hypothetical protein
MLSSTQHGMAVVCRTMLELMLLLRILCKHNNYNTFTEVTDDLEMFLSFVVCYCVAVHLQRADHHTVPNNNGKMCATDAYMLCRSSVKSLLSNSRILQCYGALACKNLLEMLPNWPHTQPSVYTVRVCTLQQTPYKSALWLKEPIKEP